MLLILSVPSPEAQSASYHSFYAAQTVPTGFLRFSIILMVEMVET